jgi:hypothetical protein
MHIGLKVVVALFLAQLLPVSLFLFLLTGTIFVLTLYECGTRLTRRRA